MFAPARPRTGGRPWSTACHVRDVFGVFHERLDRMVTEEDPKFPNWDQDATAVADQYGAQDPATVASDLHAAALALAERIDGLGADAWGRTGLRSDGASFSVETLTRYLIHDPLHHLHDVDSRPDPT